MARGESRTSPRRLLAIQRQVWALQLRVQGNTYRQIAESAGFNSRQAAHKSVSRALTRMTNAPDYVELRLDAERVDCMFVATFRDALHGDFAAIGACLALMERRSRLLAALPDGS